MTTEQNEVYAKLSDTVYFKVPNCYGSFDEEYTMDSECPRCPVMNQCERNDRTFNKSEIKR